jgi:hypothetical protein
VQIKEWVEFIQVDERVTRFAGGLMTDRSLYPEAAVVVNQERVADLDLPDGVPEPVRSHFDAARHAYCYAVFSYDLFAVAAAQASLAEEFALAERYLSQLTGPVRLRNVRTGEEKAITPTRFGLIHELLLRDGPYPKAMGWRRVSPEKVPLGLSALLDWARRDGILEAWLTARWRVVNRTVRSMVMTGELRNFVPPEWTEWSVSKREQWWTNAGRSRWEEGQLDAIRYLRNAAAHPDFATILDPAAAAHHLAAAHDFISAIWSVKSNVRS